METKNILNHKDWRESDKKINPNCPMETSIPSSFLSLHCICSGLYDPYIWRLGFCNYLSFFTIKIDVLPETSSGTLHDRIIYDKMVPKVFGYKENLIADVCDNQNIYSHLL
jgi:hypothetical protein